MRGEQDGLLTPFPVADATWRALSRMTLRRVPTNSAVGEIGLDAWIEEQLAPETINDLDCELRTRGLDTLWMTPT